MTKKNSDEMIERKYIELYRNPATRQPIAIEIVVLETKQKKNNPLRTLAHVQPIAGFGKLWVDMDCILTQDELSEGIWKN